MTRGIHPAMLIAIACLLGADRAAQASPQCVPDLRLIGATEVVTEVATRLGAHGIALGESSPCGTVTARVADDDGFVRIDIIDPEGREVRRHAPDAEAAAAIIESWVRRDVAEPLLAARTGPPPPRIEPPARDEPAAVVPATSGVATRARVGVGYDVGLSGDTAVWTAMRLQGCILVGRTCVGAIVRHSTDAAIAGDAHDAGATRRTFDAMLIVDAPLAFGPVEVVPGAGVGQASLTSTHKVFLETEKFTAVEFQMRAHIGARYGLSRHWSAHADLAAEWAPFADSDLTDTDMPDDDDVRFPGVPIARGWFGVSLTYGGL